MTRTATRTLARNVLRRLPVVSLLIWFTIAVWPSMTTVPAPDRVLPVGRSELPQATSAQVDIAIRTAVYLARHPSPAPSTPPERTSESEESKSEPPTAAPPPPPAEPVTATITTTVPPALPPAPPPTAPAQQPAAPEPPPTTVAPPAADPGTADPETADPGTADPGTADPGTVEPATSDPGTADLHARVLAAYESSVSSSWRGGLPVTLEVVDGSTSMAMTDGRITMSRYHASGDWDRLRAIVAHEFGHIIAFAYGPGTYLGEPPAGWPTSGTNPAERWADCVAQAFIGYPLGSHGQAACSGASFDWAADYLSRGPVAG